MLQSHRSIGRRVARLLTLCGGMTIAAMATSAAQAPTGAYKPLPADQLDSIVAPIALYADPLLAQVMLASTYPQQIDAAAKWVRANGTDAVDSQPWDVSVRAIAHYPSVLNLLDSNLDWTAWIGAAYANQSTDLMNAVQHMRALAQNNGNLVTTPQQEVVAQGGDIAIWPAQPDLMYVPVYDPAAIYYSSCVTVFCDPYMSFGIGYPIGSWLIYDWDWPHHRIFYTGWQGGGWVGRSRPFVGLSGVYVNERFRTVQYNRGVLPGRPSIVGGAVFGDRAGNVRGNGVPSFSAENRAASRGLVTRIAPPSQGLPSPALRSRDAGGPAENRESGIPRSSAYGHGVTTPSYRQSGDPRAYAVPRYAPQSNSVQRAPAPAQRSAPPPSYSAPRQPAPSRPSAPPARSSGGSSHGSSRGRGGR